MPISIFSSAMQADSRASKGRALYALWVGLCFLCSASGCHEKGPGGSGASRSVSALEEKGAECFAQGRYDCAMDAYAEAAKRQPHRPGLWNRFAMSSRLRFYVTGDADYRDQELDALRRAAKLPGASAQVQVNLGTVCWEMGLREEATEAYKAALARTPSHPDAQLMRERIQRSTREEDPEEQGRSAGP